MFQEFPKWLYPENGEPVLVQDAEEETALSGTPESAAEPAPAPVAPTATDTVPPTAQPAVPELARRGPGRPRKVS